MTYINIMNKFVANGLIATLVGCVVIAILESALTTEAADGLYTLAGLAIFVFGIWGAVLLYKK